MTANDEAYAAGWDEGQASIWDEVVCSSCGQNHDRDESAMCSDGKLLLFREWVESKRNCGGVLSRDGT